MSLSKSNIIRIIFIFLASLVVYSQGLSQHGVEYRDDEIFYYKSTQEMFAQGNFLSPTYFGADRFQKPILFYWFILLSYTVLGTNWFAARIVAVIFAGLTIGVTWALAKRLFSARVAGLSCLILMTIPLFFRHAKNAVPDMCLNFFIVFSIYAAVCLVQNPHQKKYGYAFFIACALGFMVKGFAALIVPFSTLVVYALATKNKSILKTINFPFGIFLILAIVLPWFIYMIGVHGETYTHHMLVTETQNRLVVATNQNILVRIISSFADNVLFYLSVLLNYFAPWSLFALGAIPFALNRTRKGSADAAALLWLLIWGVVVFVFFSLVHITISHYLLVLSTPFAILVSYFFVEISSQPRFVRRLVKFLGVVMLIGSILALSFLHVFLAEGSRLWLCVYLSFLVGLIFLIWKDFEAVLIPVFLSLVILFSLSQSKMMIKAGVTAHTTLQNFARTMNKEGFRDYAIGVGSHDLHEKEFQVYFDRKIEKVGSSYVPETRMKMSNLLRENDKVLCLLIEEDYETYQDIIKFFRMNVIQEDYIFRKRLYLDKNFFAALLNLDRDQIHKYLKEKVLLLEKNVTLAEIVS